MPGISDLLDSDMETNNFIDENSLISSVSDTTAIAQAKEEKKPRKRVCVGMPKKKPRASAEAKPRAQKRKAIPEENLDEDDLVETQPAQPRGRKPKEPKELKEPKKTEKGQRKPRKQDPISEDEEQPEADIEAPSPVNIRSNFATTTTTKRAPKPVQARTKARKAPIEEPEEVSESVEDEIQQPAKRKCIRPEPTYRQHRAGSVSSTGSRTERDPLLRRKLGDLTQKYQNIDHKYRSLKDVAIAEANDNVEKMRRQCEAVSSASESLVATLKAQLAAQAAPIAETKKLKKDIQSRDSEIDNLKKAHESVLKSLGAAQSEIKALQAKLSAARATPTPIEAKQPTTTKKIVTGPESERIAQLKIDLYGDLTGLIVRGVKQGPDGETYDCIQTGRNGTLHFKLFVDAENAKTASFEQTEFLYTPLLDANRDKDLIEIMPDYLAEDITFEREVAAKFYARVVKTLTEKVEYDDEDAE